MLEKSIPHVCLAMKVALICVDTWTVRISGIDVRQMKCHYTEWSKILCTWRLQYNHQVHRDVLITLYNVWCVVCYDCDYDLWVCNFFETINFHEHGNTIKEEMIFFSPRHGATAPSGSQPPHFRGVTITLRHTTLGRNPLDEWSTGGRDLYLTTHNR